LVFSTLHTNDASSAFTRLIDMGHRTVPRGVISRGGDGATARAHDFARVAKTEQKSRGGLFAQNRISGRTKSARRSSGAARSCEDCRHLVYQGRKAWYEHAHSPTNPSGPFILNRAPATDVLPKRPRTGHAQLRTDGLDQGEERRDDHRGVLRVTQIEEHMDRSPAATKHKIHHRQ